MALPDARLEAKKKREEKKIQCRKDKRILLTTNQLQNNAVLVLFALVSPFKIYIWKNCSFVNETG